MLLRRGWEHSAVVAQHQGDAPLLLLGQIHGLLCSGHPPSASSRRCQQDRCRRPYIHCTSRRTDALAVAPEAGWVTEQLSWRSARRAVMVRVLLAVPAAEQFASCLRPSRYQVSTEPGAARGARQVKARLSSSRSVHEASGRPSMVGPGSLSPTGAPRARQSCRGGLPAPRAVPDPTRTSPARQSTGKPSSSSGARAAPGQPLRLPMAAGRTRRWGRGRWSRATGTSPVSRARGAAGGCNQAAPACSSAAAAPCPSCSAAPGHAGAVAAPSVPASAAPLSRGSRCSRGVTAAVEAAGGAGARHPHAPSSLF